MKPVLSNRIIFTIILRIRPISTHKSIVSPTPSQYPSPSQSITPQPTPMNPSSLPMPSPSNWKSTCSIPIFEQPSPRPHLPPRKQYIPKLLPSQITMVYSILKSNIVYLDTHTFMSENNLLFAIVDMMSILDLSAGHGVIMLDG